jgi:hypothetical protein
LLYNLIIKKVNINFMRNDFETPQSAPKKPENTENIEVMEKPETNIASKENITSAEIEEIKKGDAEKLKAVSFKEIVDNGKEQEKKEKLLALAKEKIEEMQREIDEKKKGFINNMFISKEEIAAAELHLKNARAEVGSGTVPDMESLRRHVKFAQKVDVSEFPASKKKLVAGGSPGNDLRR